jgi:hypothetical protein
LTEGGAKRRKALRLYSLCQSHIAALAAAAQPVKHNIVVLYNRGQYIKLYMFAAYKKDDFCVYYVKKTEKQPDIILRLLL